MQRKMYIYFILGMVIQMEIGLFRLYKIQRIDSCCNNQLGNGLRAELTKRCHLYIFMDSCHSAAWCQRLAKDYPQINISMFASCSEGEQAKDLEGGGLLNRCILAVNQNQVQQDIELLFHPSMKQTPHFINKTDKVYLMTKQHVALLQKDIKNAYKIKPSISQNQSPSKKNPSPSKKNSSPSKNSQSPSKNSPSPSKKPQIDWNSLKSQQVIILQNKNICQIPQSISMCKNLKQLVLNDNKITLLPSSICKLPLIRLHIRNNDLQQLPYGFGDMTTLGELSLANNKKIGAFYKGTIPACILSLKNLLTLGMYNTGLIQVPQRIDQLKCLRNLQLASNQIKSLPQSICNLQKLQILCIHSNMIKSIPTNIHKMKKLLRLCIFRNPFMSLPSTLGYCQNLQQILITIVDQSNIQLAQLSVAQIPQIRLIQIQLHKKLQKNQKDAFQALCQDSNVKLQWVKEWGFA